MIMLYNLLHNMYNFIVFKLFTPALINYLTRFKLFQYQSRTDLSWKHLFSTRVINSWNDLPGKGGGGVVDATSTSDFKCLFNKFKCMLCNCVCMHARIYIRTRL